MKKFIKKIFNRDSITSTSKEIKWLIKIIIIFFIAISVVIAIIALAVETREKQLKKGISIQAKYDIDNCYINLPKNETKITKTQMKDILAKAPADVEKIDILDGLILRGYEIEDITPEIIKEVLAKKQAISVIIKNNTNKTLEKVGYDIGVRRIGYSTDISSYDLHRLTSDKILKPGEEANFCITKNLKDIDQGFIKTPEKFEFFTNYVRPEFH